MIGILNFLEASNYMNPFHTKLQHNWISINQSRLCRYGNLFKTCLFGYPIIISTDPHVNNFILENDGRLFVPQFPTSIGVLSGKSNIMASRGDYHKKKRGVYTRVIGLPVLKHRLPETHRLF